METVPGLENVISEAVVERALPALCKEKQWYLPSSDGDWCAHPASFACKYRDYGTLKKVRCYSSGTEYCMARCRVREED